MNVRSISFLLLLMPLAMACGCHQDMYDQAKKEPLESSEFFKDGRVARTLVPGTIARGHLETDTPMFTGRESGQFVAELPVPVTDDLVKQGQKQFNIYCAPCHGSIGDGDGIIPSRGFKRPPSYHSERLRGTPVGHYFDVMTNGFGSMPSFKNRLSPEDRWAITAYVRALQLSQFAPASTLSETELNALNAPVRGTSTDAPRQ